MKLSEEIDYLSLSTNLFNITATRVRQSYSDDPDPNRIGTTKIKNLPNADRNRLSYANIECSITDLARFIRVYLT